MNNKLIKLLQKKESVFFNNPVLASQGEFLNKARITLDEVIDAKRRWDRFRPYLKNKFPDTSNGRVKSEIREVSNFKKELEEKYGTKIKGRVFVKMDNTLPIAGSIKARGGIYEVLKVTEQILIKHNFLTLSDDYSKIERKEARDILSRYSIVVGSTGNLGLSVGIMASALGFKAEVHMSRDAKEWKKRLLRKWGATVIEHEGDYLFAVRKGRERCIGDEFAHFVDDENSKDLFLGYATAAFELKEQLKKLDIVPTKDYPLHVYIPCGVGGAAGGITFGLAHIFGSTVRSYVAEPVGAPCVIGALITGKDDLHIEEIGIKLKTEADGLAVGSPSKLAMPILRGIIAGAFTLSDKEMLWAVKKLYLTENIKIEPSAGAGIKGVYFTEKYIKGHHLIWLTGGKLIPDEEFEKLILGNL